MHVRAFDFLAPNFLIIFLSAIFLTLSVPGYWYSRNAPSAVNSIATFLLMKYISTQMPRLHHSEYNIHIVYEMTFEKYIMQILRDNCNNEKINTHTPHVKNIATFPSWRR